MTSNKTFTKTLVTTEEQYEELYQALLSSGIFSYDTETNGNFNRFRVRLVGASFAVMAPEPRAWYLPLNHVDGEQLPFGYFMRLGYIFSNPEIEKICHNAKFDEMVLQRHGISVEGKGHDTLVMAWLLERSKLPRGLKPLTKRILGVDMVTYEDLVDSVPRKRGEKANYDFANVQLEPALSYAADDAYFTHKIFDIFKSQLQEEDIWDAYENIERPLVRVLKNIEERGVYIDKDYLDFADKKLPEIYEKVEAKIFEEAGEVFNHRSGQQLGKILYDKLGIGTNVPKTASGQYSTNQKTLEQYSGKHEIVENVLRCKKIRKTHSTFVQGTAEYIASDDKVHPSFNGIGTITGRLSCSSPNLQQIEGDEVEEVKVRDFFRPTPGYKFIVSDYSQVELRVMAHVSRDPVMMEAFTSDREFHKETAARVFSLQSYEEITRSQLTVAKTLNFGVPYGRGDKGIAEQLEISRQEAKKFIRDWWNQFPTLAGYKRHVITQARKSGYVRTLSGRKRWLLPDIRDSNGFIRGSAERRAFNTRIQGSAADIIKLAMIQLEPYLKEHDSYIVIQIHDELVIEVPDDIVNEVLINVKKIMENPLNGKNPLRVPLVTHPVVVDKWGDAK